MGWFLFEGLGNGFVFVCLGNVCLCGEKVQRKQASKQASEQKTKLRPWKGALSVGLSLSVCLSLAPSLVFVVAQLVCEHTVPGPSKV